MLLAFGGPLYGAEQWSISLRSTPNFADNDAVGLDRIADLVGDWHEGAPAVVGGFAPLTWVKFNRVGVDGKYVADRTNRVDFAPPRVNNTGSPHAPQVSLVATLETGPDVATTCKSRRATLRLARSAWATAANS